MQDTPDEDDDPEGVLFVVFDVLMTRVFRTSAQYFLKKRLCLHPTIMDLGRMQHQDFKEIPPGKLTWQWKTHYLKMYFLLKIGIFQCHVGFHWGSKKTHLYHFWCAIHVNQLNHFFFNQSIKPRSLKKQKEVNSKGIRIPKMAETFRSYGFIS